MTTQIAANTVTHRVYILPTADGSQSKVGQTGTELNRVMTMKCLYPEIDLTRSVIVEVDSHQIERALHIAFGPRRQARSVRCDGFTEWFRGDLVDEAIDFLATMAACRGVNYRVIRNIDALIREQRPPMPRLVERAPHLSAAERSARAELAKVRMREAAIEHGQRVGDRIAESGFDSLVRCGGYAYVARTVLRADAPECWDPKTGHHGSVWGRRFAESSMADIHVDGASCLFHMLNPPVFGAIDAAHGREYIRIYQDRPIADGGGTSDPDIFSPAAFGALWRVLDQLPVIELPGEWPDLPETGVAGLQ